MPVLTSPWDTPDLVGAALRESLRIGYLESTRSETGRFLATMAASRHGTIADFGTGCGVGTAWLRSGAPASTRVVTVERDPALAESATRLFAGTGVEVMAGDWSTMDWTAHGIDSMSLVTIDIGTAGQACDRLDHARTLRAASSSSTTCTAGASSVPAVERPWRCRRGSTSAG